MQRRNFMKHTGAALLVPSAFVGREAEGADQLVRPKEREVLYAVASHPWVPDPVTLPTFRGHVLMPSKRLFPKPKEGPPFGTVIRVFGDVTFEPGMHDRDVEWSLGDGIAVGPVPVGPHLDEKMIQTVHRRRRKDLFQHRAGLADVVAEDPHREWLDHTRRWIEERVQDGLTEAEDAGISESHRLVVLVSSTRHRMFDDRLYYGSALTIFYVDGEVSSRGPLATNVYAAIEAIRG